MATIKSFTSLEQSKVLAEILPHETADMCIGNYVGKSGKVDGTNIHYYPKGESFGAPQIIEAWSLAALVSVLPLVDFTMPQLIGTPKTLYRCIYNDDLKSHAYDNPVDACYEMILKLHELKML